MSDRLKMPPEKDFGFYQRRKHDKWREVPAPLPALEASVADSHAHVHMLPDPAWELARSAANGVDCLCMIVDPSEDGARPFEELTAWQQDAREHCSCLGGDDGGAEGARGDGCPEVRIAVGVHPHNAKLYDDAVERELRARLADPRVGALGEIGLDYHYDLSPRSVQRSVFLRQIQLAKEAGLPIALHLRGGEPAEGDARSGRTTEGGTVQCCSDANADAHAEAAAGAGAGSHAGESVCEAGSVPTGDSSGEAAADALERPQSGDAHAEALAILREVGFPERGVLLHCCSLAPGELRPWIDAGCYIAYGGALTFKNAEAAREGARLVPADRLMLETDAPYMTPEPMRGAACTPAHVIFTAAALAEVRGISPGVERKAFLQQLHDNTTAFYAR